MAAVQVESSHTLQLRLDSPGTNHNASVPVQYQKQKEQKKAVPRLWHLGDGFAVSALQSSWYQALFSIQSTFFHASTDFFRRPDLDYKYLLVPLTTGSISSPMGLGSDSQPVSIQLHGEDTYLADSQQFLLEYALRYDDNVEGVYYVGTSCRGEDHDSTHLNQFCHVECELRGGFEQGMDVANRYIVYIIQKLLETHGDVIKAHVGSIKHMTDLIQLYLGNGKAFPTVTLDEALQLPEIADGEGIMWEYTVPGRPECGRGLKRKGEQALIARFGGAVWLVEMDHLGVPFYQAYSDETSKNKALCGDLLIGLGEVVGCGNRHTTAEQVLEALDQHAVDPAEYAWYVEMRKLKAINTTGWGIGSERFLSWVLQHDDIRDIQLLPRLKGQTCAP